MKKVKCCEDFLEGSPLRNICDGSADLDLYKINIYRNKMGLLPIKEEERAKIVVSKPKPEISHLLKLKEHPSGDLTPRILSKPPSKYTPPKTLLGDKIGDALKIVGINDERVSKWLGRPCGCAGRRRKLNKLDLWIRKTLAKDEDVKLRLEELEKMLDSNNV
jgi:hypothetical protein